MKKVHRIHPPSLERGAAALAVSLVLLFGMTVIAFFANRGMLFEQRTSANQYRSTKAFEMAEAGLEWAVAQLNTQGAVATAPSCAPSTAIADVTFARRYLTIGAGGIGVVANGRPAGSIASNGAVTAECPAPGNNATLGNDSEPRFRVEFQTVASDPWSIRIISRGCTNAGAPCDLASAATPDGQAVVTAIYKMKPAVPLAPGAGLVTGGAASVTTGSMNVINEDRLSNGITINSGSLIDLGSGTNVFTIAGTPPQASVLDNDPSLRNLANADGTGNIMFQSFTGKTFTEFQESSDVWVITRGTCPAVAAGRCSTCSSDSDCGTKVMDAYTNNRYEKFWADTAATTIQFGTSNRPAASATNPDRTFGTADRPLIIGSLSNVDFNGAITAYGLFYAATASATDNYVVVGTGNATVVGSIVTRSDFSKGAGTMNLVYRADLFSPSLDFGTMVRVPGSWRDSLNEL
jgi:hypothetical protein